MEPASEVIFRVRRYLRNELSLDQLEDWLIPRLPMLFSLPDTSVACQLTSLIELSRAELGSGIITEDEFKEALHAFLDPVETIDVVISGPQTDSINSSSVELSDSQFAARSREGRVTIEHR